MKHIQTLNGATLKASAAKGGCGECQTSCQSACKTSCTVANQKCENQSYKTALEKGRRQPALLLCKDALPPGVKGAGRKGKEILTWYIPLPPWASTWRRM